MGRRSLPLPVHLLAALFVVLAVGVVVVGDAGVAAVVLPVAVAVAFGVLAVVLMNRSTRFRFGLAMVGWAAAAFVAGGLAADGQTAFLIAALVYPAVLLETTALFDLRGTQGMSGGSGDGGAEQAS